jgi:hypothetical protein
MLVELKRTGALLLTLVNLALFVWAVLVYRKRGAMPDGYYRLLAASPVVAAFQVALGLTFLAQGYRPPGMHLFYGIMVGVGSTAQAVLNRRTAAGHAYRARPLVHLVLALFVGLLAARAWMAA